MTDVYVWYLLRQRLEELRHEATAQRRAARSNAVLAADRSAARREREGRATLRREGGALSGGRVGRARRSAPFSRRERAGRPPECCCDAAAYCASAT